MLPNVLDLDIYREKDKNISFRLCCVNLEDCSYGCVQIIGFWLRCVQNINRISSTRNIKDRSLVKIFGEFFGIQGCTRD